MKKTRLFLLAAFLIFGITSCQYEFWIPEEIPDFEDPNAEQISFTHTIQPIFTNNCISCHKTGGIMPDLTEGNAYSSINTSRYINSGTPVESRIYTYTSPTSNTHTQKKYTETQAAYVLGWIQQGAKNN